MFQLQLLLFSGLAFFLMLGWLKRTLTITLDVDWLYRGLGVALTRWADAWAGIAWSEIVGATARSGQWALDGIKRSHGAGGILARTWPTGTMAFWMTVVLAAYLILSYL